MEPQPFGYGEQKKWGRERARLLLLTMRLNISANSADEVLIALTNDGYTLAATVRHDYQQKKAGNSYSEVIDNVRYEAMINEWGERVRTGLISIFPTELEWNLFVNPEVPLGAVSGDYKFESLVKRLLDLALGLDKIRSSRVPQYTDLPAQLRLFVEDIDSFRKVRDVNPASVADLINGGRLDWSEDRIQIAFEQILDVPMHKKDWGGEINDLYTANVILNGKRTETAFLLKGNGLTKKTMEIANCGHNGDQILRLVGSPARLFVVQFVGNISESVISDIDGKMRVLRTQGTDARFCIIDGQDTARVLRAYGKA
jgi:hypothetical protein